jgi:hypothetical protein
LLRTTKYSSVGDGSAEITQSTSAQLIQFRSLSSESKPLSLESWESDYKLGVPFKITECHIEFVSLNKQQFLEEYGIDDTKQVENNGLIHLEFLKTSLSKSSYGVRVKLDSEYSFHLKLNLELEVFSKEIRPIFNFI